MDYKCILEDFFKCYRKQISIEKLIQKFGVDRGNIDCFLDSLYELEMKGNIIFDKSNKTYMVVPSQFFYDFGCVRKSNSSKYYIKTNGCVINISGNMNVKEGDYVYVLRTKQNHPKQFLGKVMRVVHKEKVCNSYNCIVKGILKKDGNHFYITAFDDRVYIPRENINTAFAGDLVNVKILGSSGSVIEVLKRHQDNHVFRCVKVMEDLKWVPIGSSYGYYDVDKFSKFCEGDMIVASFVDGKLKVVQKLKNNNSIQDEINALIVDFGFDYEFPLEVIREANSFSKEIDLSEIKKRVDLRELETFTIDPVDAKDLDDAVSLVCEGDINHLYVHMANPTHYIKLNSSVFKEALRRSFSVYPTTDVIPMLPDVFSSGVCSLNEDGDKLALTCKMSFNRDGKMIDFNIFKSVIRSNKQMDYDSVNEFMENINSHLDYLPFYNTLFKMRELSYALDKNRMERGSISFEGEERQFILNESKEPVGIEDVSRGEAQNIIENFMLVANETMANYAYYLSLPCIYRNHDKPSVQKQLNLKNNLLQSGYLFQKIGNIDNPLILQKFLNDLLKGKNKDERRVICDFILRSMTRAYYDDKNIGHYGLALNCYATFTSPARKISDLLNHMVIEEFLDYGIQSSKLDTYRDFIGDVCEYISLKQKDADLLEQEINQLMLEKYSLNFIDVKERARILFVNKHGIYVKDENGLTGVIPINREMKVKNNGVIYQGHVYHVNEQISVMFMGSFENELRFAFNNSEDKTLVRVKK